MDAEFGRREYLLLVLGAIGYACYTFVWFSVPALLSPLIDEFGLSTTEAGLLVGAIPLMYVPLGLFGGLVIDRVGSRWAIGGGLVAVGHLQIVRGIADSFVGLLLPTLLLGVAGMTATFGLPKLVSELFPVERTGTMSSVYQIGSHVGPVVAFSLSRPVLEPLLGGWRPVFVASGAVIVAFSIVWAIAAVGYSRSLAGERAAEDDTDEGGGGEASEGVSGEGRERGSERVSGERRDGDSEEGEGEKAASERGSGEIGSEKGDGGERASGDGAFTLESMRTDLARLFSHRNMLLLVLVGTMYLFITHGLRGWLVVILEETGLTPELAALLASLLIVAEIVGTVAIPSLSDRLGRRRGALFACGVLCFVGTTGLLLVPTSVVGAGVVVGIIGLGTGGLSPMVKAVPIDMDGIGPPLAATAVSFVYAVGEIGGFTGPFLMGALRDATGTFEAALVPLVVASGIILLASASMTRLTERAP